MAVNDPELVRGLGLFRDRFAEFQDSYVLIGGTASLLVLREADLQFRATHDLDLVLCVESLTDRFFGAFWEFVREGGYAVRERESGPRKYYRFRRPRNESFPFMLELFSRKPDGITVPAGVVLTPIPTDSDFSGLSAILLDDTYYHWILNGRRKIAGLTVVGAEHLIPMKARAFLDLSTSRANGEAIDSAKVNKHRNDVIRLAQLLLLEPLENDVPEEIRDDVRRFVNDPRLTPADLKSLRLQIRDPTAVINTLKIVYGLSDQPVRGP